MLLNSTTSQFFLRYAERSSIKIQWQNKSNRCLTSQEGALIQRLTVPQSQFSISVGRLDEHALQNVQRLEQPTNTFLIHFVTLKQQTTLHAMLMPVTNLPSFSQLASAGIEIGFDNIPWFYCSFISETQPTLQPFAGFHT